jgi:hypothetical protein
LTRGGGGGLLNGLNSEDQEDEDDYIDEDSEELMAIKNTGNRLGGLHLFSLQCSNFSDLCTYMKNCSMQI